MSNALQTGKFALTGIIMLLSSATDTWAQQVQNDQQTGLLRPALDVDNANQNNPQTVATRAPVQQNNAPQPIRLQSNQPQSLPLPPPPPPPQPEADPFQPIGIQAGSFRLFPVLEITSNFTDNVRTDPGGKLKDVGLRLAPSLRLQSDWVRHSLNFNASSQHVFYAKAKEINSNTFTASSALQLDIRHDTNLVNTTTYQLSETSSASSEVPGTAIGNRNDHELSFTSALTHRFTRVVATLTGGIDWLFFDDVKLTGGGRENNDDREYIEPSARLRLGYEISPAIIPFTEVGYTPRIHKKTLDRNGLARDSQGLTASAGVGFNLSPIWDGEVALVFEHRDFKDSSLNNINALGLNASINWRPTELTTLTFASTSSIDESTTAGISGIRNFGLAFDITHRFRENLTGTLDFGFVYNDFIGTGNDDKYYTVQAGFAYAIRRELEWIANYQFTHFQSGTAGSSYTENRISTGVRFRL